MRITFTSFIVSVLFCSQTAFSQVNLTNGLVGCYPFSGNANDLSISQNNGDVQGPQLTSDRFGNADAAYDFDGVDDHIEIDAANLELNEFTYSIWVKPESVPSYGQGLFLFSIGSDYGDQHMLFGDHYSNDRHTGLSHGSYLGVANNILCSESFVNPIDQWYHVVLVRNATDYILYVNNKVVCTNSHGGQKAFYGTSTVRAMIGARNNYGQAANATIDDIHLYNRPLNNAEITALFDGVGEVTSSGFITTSTPRICTGEPVTLTAVSNIPSPTVKWSVDGVVQAASTSEELIFRPHSATSSYHIIVKAEVTPEASCFVQKPLVIERDIEVKICNPTEGEGRTMYVPAVFTPNQDGINDGWKIINIEQYDNVELTVYNRWGEVIFYSPDYQTPWDGIYRGKVVPAGIYTYKIVSEKKLLKAGKVNIIY